MMRFFRRKSDWEITWRSFEKVLVTSHRDCYVRADYSRVCLYDRAGLKAVYYHPIKIEALN